MWKVPKLDDKFIFGLKMSLVHLLLILNEKNQNCGWHIGEHEKSSMFFFYEHSLIYEQFLL